MEGGAHHGMAGKGVARSIGGKLAPDPVQLPCIQLQCCAVAAFWFSAPTLETWAGGLFPPRLYAVQA